MGFTVNSSYAFIPRLVGYFGIDTFLILEIEYVLYEIQIKPILRHFYLGILIVYELFDMIICGPMNALIYIRTDYYTYYENANLTTHVFHYSFILTTAISLVTLAVLWYRKQTITREKNMIITISLSHVFVFISSVLDFANNKPLYNFRTFSFCAGIAFVFFVWYLCNRKTSMFIPSVENVSKEVFYTIDVPIIIFDLSGTIKVCNPAATNKFRAHDQNIEEAKINIRDFFTFTDVESMHLLSKSKNAISSRYKTSIKSTKEECFLSCYVKLDYTGEPFCVIGTVAFCTGGD